MTKIKISRKKRTGGQGEDDEESRSLHLSDLQGDEGLNDLSMISNASDDEHEIPETDLNISGVENDESGMTEGESFGTINEFPTLEENEMNQTFPDDSSLHLSDLNTSNSMASQNTTHEEESFVGGKRKTKKHRKSGAKTKKNKKSKKNKLIKKRKTLKRKHHKKNKTLMSGGFIGDNGTDMELYGETNPYSVDRDSDARF
jgi:hypothetical protein